jgi:hypothetical protein
MAATHRGESTGLIREYFSFDRDLDNLFVESGRQAHVIWRLDGSFGGLRAVSTEIVNPPGGGTEGIWAEPLRLADYVHLHVGDAAGGLAAVERNAKRHSRRVGWTDIDYEFGSHPYLKVRKTIWVPLQRPAVVVEARLENRSDQPRSLCLFVEFRSHLSIGWPRREGGRNTAAFDPALPGIVAHDEGHPEWTALCASSRPPEAWHLGDFAPHLIGTGGLSARSGGATGPGPGCSCLQFGVTLPPDGGTTVAVVVCGSPRSEEEARATCREICSRREELREEKCRHYADLFSRTAVLDSPSYVFNKAFLWAKLGTEDFKHHDPRLGFLFFAGYPAYNFYFASDTMLILRGSFAFGDFEDARRMLRTIVRYQATEAGRDTLPGEIWHEMSTTGDRISPNFAGFLFPGVIRAFFEWSADRAFLEEMYPCVCALVEWGYRMDANGDGLLENGPEGEMADSASEDRNVERSHYTVQVQWLDALREGVHLAGLVGDADSAARWTETATRVRDLVNRVYWNESKRCFEETIRPDGTLDTSGKGLANLDPTMVDEGKAAATARLLLDEEAYLADIEAFTERQRFEEVFSTHRAYMSWYVMERGRRVLQLYRTHRAEPAYRALEEIAASPFHWTTPGMWPEVWAVDEPSVLRARGCFHQAWTGSHGFIHPVVSGMLGIRPDAPRDGLAFEPHLPPHWPRLALRRMRLGDGWFDVGCEQGDGWRRLSVRNDGGRPLSVELGFVLPAGVLLRELLVDGRARELSGVDARTTASDTHVGVTVTAPPGAEASAELRWETAPLSLAFVAVAASGAPMGRSEPGPVFLPRLRPGSSGAVEAEIGNRSCRRARVEIGLELQGDGVRVARSRRMIDLEPGAERRERFDLEALPDASEGYRTLRLRIHGDPALLLERTAHLPVFRSLAPSLDARQVARIGRPFVVQVSIASLAADPLTAEARLEWPGGWDDRGSGDGAAAVEPGGRESLAFSAAPVAAGERELEVAVRCRETGEEWRLGHRVSVLPAETRMVLHSGFLRCPIASGGGIEVVNLPANYAVRRPHVLEQLLGQADLVLTSDQHDAVFPDAEIAAIVEFVRRGGSLVFFCHWSAPWGRGFFETFGNFASSALPDILPLRMRKGITHARAVRLAPAGSPVFGGIAWDTIPAYDHNDAELREGATLLAASEAGAPLIASWRHGAGGVLAIAIDCFGFESYVEGLSFDFWPGKPALVGAAVRSMLEAR